LTNQGIALAIISHDLAQIAQVADEIMVMRNGEIVESGPTDQLLNHPNHEYTKQLLAAIPAGVERFVPLTRDLQQPETPHLARPAPAESRERSDELAVQATGLSKTFGDHLAVNDVTLSIPRGTTLGLVGESGSGKTTTARMILGLTAPDTGTVEI